MPFRLEAIVTPVRYLALINLGIGLVSLSQSLVVARLLGPALLGVIAVIIGINATVLNFLDIRLTDLAAKLYYQTDGLTDEAARAHRASVLALCLLGNAFISLMLGVLGVGVSWLIVGWFTEAAVAIWWLVAQAVLLGMTNIGNTLTFLQRFSGRFYFVGTARLLVHILGVSVFLWVFIGAGDIDGYYTAALTSATLTLLGTLSLTTCLWARWDKLPIFRLRLAPALPLYRQHTRFIFFGNLLGYSKLLHRAADMLVVGHFASDSVTGIYKLARSLTDGLYVLFDAMNQVYQPRFLELLAKQDWHRYRQLARRIFTWCLLFTLVAVAAQAALLRPLLGWLFGGKYAGIELPIMLLTAPFLFVTGISIWLYPTFIHSGRLGKFTLANSVAALGQYGVMLSLFNWHAPGAASAAAAYLAHYMLLYPLAYAMARRRFREYLPL